MIWSMSFSDQRSCEAGIPTGLAIVEADNLTDAATRAFSIEGVDQDWIVRPYLVEALNAPERKLPKNKFISSSKLQKMEDYVVVRT